MGLRYLLVSRRRYQIETGSGPLASSQAEVVTLPWYGLVGLRLSQELPWVSGPDLRVYLEASNLGDAYYEQAPARPAPGRRLALGVEGRL